jgi:hypothetical protein
MTVSLRPLSPQGVNVSQSLPAVAPGEPFTITGIIPSAYAFNAIVSGWTLKSATWNGRDVADVPLDIKPGQDVSNIVLTFADRMAEVTGVLYDATGKASSDLGVVLFPVDRAMLIPGSRRVRAPVRPGTDGRFAFSNLVAGEYYLAVVGDVSISTADLVSPQLLDQLIPTAIKLMVADGERKVQDIRIK